MADKRFVNPPGLKPLGMYSNTACGRGTMVFIAGQVPVDAQGQIVTADGFAVEPAISIPENATSITITKDGFVSVKVAGESAPQQVGTIELANFQNAPGLEAIGGNLFRVSTASGEATTAQPGQDGMGVIIQGFLEESNVSVVEEMVGMILGQRAYEANQRMIQTHDELMQRAVSEIARPVS